MTVCESAGCDRNVLCRGLCKNHHQQAWAAGLLPRLDRRSSNPCELEGCYQSKYSRGLCRRHYMEQKEAGTLRKKQTTKLLEVVCSVDGCVRLSTGSGMCQRHHNNHDRYGHAVPLRDLSAYEYVVHVGWDIVESGCWEYRGGRNEHGYGMARGVRVHRIVHEQTVGPIPDGMNVLHSCDNPPCVNPEHLRIGTKWDNTQDILERKRHPVWEATHCRNGHEYTGRNDLGRGKKSRCRTCNDARQARWRASR